MGCVNDALLYGSTAAREPRRSVMNEERHPWASAPAPTHRSPSTALVETAAWGAELATAPAGIGERGHIYVVEPMGPFEDDPNVTDK